MGDDERIADDREVGFRSGDVTVAGSWRGPTRGSTPVPAAVLIAGSGPVDRDGNATVAPFAGLRFDCLRWLADLCSAAGIASLRYDKLGVGATGPAPFGSPTLSDMDFDAACVQPARDALAFTATQPGIDPRRLLIVGHSEGGGIALAVAASPRGAPAPARLALVEPVYERVLDALARQLADHVAAAGFPPAVTAGLLEWIERGVAEIRSGSPPFPPPGPVPFPEADGLLAHGQQLIASAVYERFRNHLGKTEDELDPLAMAAAVGVPTFVSAGTKDFNTPVREAGGGGVATLAAAFPDGVADYSVIPDMHHTLRDIGSADMMLPEAEALTHPFSQAFADAFTRFVTSWEPGGRPTQPTETRR